MKNHLVSIIVRTKNESIWIGKCLHAINNQTYRNIEVILVDDKSKDNTLKIVKKNFPKVKIVNYKDKKFFPGKAINLGIRKSKGKYIAIISGHCIPKDNLWIKNLIKNFSKKKIAAVYGKQEPLDFSDSNIVRDLTYLFGNDRKIQSKDPFFHNANSMIRKDLWNKLNFDEKTPHIEDRIWAQKMINKGLKIVYEPKSSVFHYHGVSHSHNPIRTNRIGKILTNTKFNNKIKNIICMVPILNPIESKGNFLVEEAVNNVLKLIAIKKVFVICDNKILKRKFIKNKKIIFLDRGKDLKKDFLGTDYVLKEVYNKFIKNIYKPSHILVFEELYPHRPKFFFKQLLEKIDDNYDTLVPISKSRFHNFWKKNSDGKLEAVAKTSLPSSVTESNIIYQEIKGLGSITSSSAFEINGRESSNAKFFEVDTEYSFKIDNYLKKLIKLKSEIFFH